MFLQQPHFFIIEPQFSSYHQMYFLTILHKASEVILKASKYTKSTDVWLIGSIFAKILGRALLFPGIDYLY